MNNYAKWFGRIVWVGVLANFAMALPALFLPDEMLAMMSLPSASPGMWPSFAALLLMLLSLFYIPAAINPLKYLPVAWMAVLARLAGVSQPYLAQLENGQREGSVSVYQRLARRLGLSVDELLPDEAQVS